MAFATAPKPAITDPLAGARLLARTDLAAYAFLVHGIRPARHAWEWVKLLERLERTASCLTSGVPFPEGFVPLRRLLMIAHPGSAKSTWMRAFTEWYMGRHPDHSVMNFMSNETLAKLWGNPIKAVLEGGDFAAVFPEADCRVDGKRGASVVDGLFLNGMPQDSGNPNFRSIGLSGSSIGTRLHGGLMDDPLTQKEQESDLEVENAINLFEGTLDNRLHPQSGWFAAIMTSFRDNDFAHYLANKGWYVLHMPAVGDDAIRPISKRAVFYSLPKGQPLWPERFTPEYFHGDPKAPEETEERKGKIKSLGKARFNAIWQGDPTAMGGLVFKERSWFRPLPADFDKRDGVDNRTPRERLRLIQAWDFNFSLLETANYTVGITVGLDEFRNMYVLGMCRGHFSPTTDVYDRRSLAGAMVEEIVAREPHLVAISDAAFRQKVCIEIWNTVRRHVGAAILKPKMAQGDKESMALVPAGRAEAGQVFVDMDAPWADDFILECLAFPKGVYDDQVDAFSLAAAVAAEKTIYLPEDFAERGTYSFRA